MLKKTAENKSGNVKKDGKIKERQGENKQSIKSGVIWHVYGVFEKGAPSIIWEACDILD